MGLLLSAILFVGLHFLLSHPLRRPLVRTLGEGPFRGIYLLLALVTFAAMVYFYRKCGREPPLWDAAQTGWIAGTLLMWLAAILSLAPSLAIRLLSLRASREGVLGASLRSRDIR
ncbi:MAG: NnrU family protein [Sphingomicrobium sp.]